MFLYLLPVLSPQTFQTKGARFIYLPILRVSYFRLRTAGSFFCMQSYFCETRQFWRCSLMSYGALITR